MCLWVAETKNERQLFVWELMGKDAKSSTVLDTSDLSRPSPITYIAVTVLSVYKQMFAGAKSTEYVLKNGKILEN